MVPLVLVVPVLGYLGVILVGGLLGVARRLRCYAP